jgi:hypothetical protein
MDRIAVTGVWTWPNLPENRAGWSIAVDLPTPEEAAMAR